MLLYALLVLCLVVQVFPGEASAPVNVFGDAYRTTYRAGSHLKYPVKPDLITAAASINFTRVMNFNIFNDSIVIGASDCLYHLSLNLTYISKFSWNFDNNSLPDCEREERGFEFVCHNYIRTYQKIPSNEDLLFVCGTWGHLVPRCRTVNIGSGMLGEGFPPIEVNTGLVSYYPEYSGFGEFIGQDEKFFSAAFKFRNRNYMLSYQEMNFTDPMNPRVQQVYQARQSEFWLRHPVTFVDYYRANYYGNNIPSENVEFYFVFLRENFMAADNRGSPIEIIYSRVVRLCRNDPGTTDGEYFSTFVKARIFCSLDSPPEDVRDINTINYLYNEITSVAFNEGQGRFTSSGDWSKKMYGAFTGSNIGPSGSALCVYNADRNMDRGVYEIFTSDLIDYSIPDSPRETENRYTLCGLRRPDNVAQNQVEQLQSISQLGEDPLFVMDGIKVTQMVIDVQCVVSATERTTCKNQDVLFLGTDQGTILKLLFGDFGTRNYFPIVAEEITLTDSNNPVQEMVIKTIGNERYIYASTESRVYRISLQRCSRHKGYMDCVGSRDPHCVWNTINLRCEVSNLTADGRHSGSVPSYILQNVRDGVINNLGEVYLEESTYTVSESATSLTVDIINNGSIFNGVVEVLLISDRQVSSGPINVAINGNYSVSVSVPFDASTDAERIIVQLRGTDQGAVYISRSEAVVMVELDAGSQIGLFRLSDVCSKWKYNQVARKEANLKAAILEAITQEQTTTNINIISIGFFCHPDQANDPVATYRFSFDISDSRLDVKRLQMSLADWSSEMPRIDFFDGSSAFVDRRCNTSFSMLSEEVCFVTGNLVVISSSLQSSSNGSNVASYLLAVILAVVIGICVVLVICVLVLYLKVRRLTSSQKGENSENPVLPGTSPDRQTSPTEEGEQPSSKPLMRNGVESKDSPFQFDLKKAPHGVGSKDSPFRFSLKKAPDGKKRSSTGSQSVDYNRNPSYIAANLRDSSYTEPRGTPRGTPIGTPSDVMPAGSLGVVNFHENSVM